MAEAFPSQEANVNCLGFLDFNFFAAEILSGKNGESCYCGMFVSGYAVELVFYRREIASQRLCRNISERSSKQSNVYIHTGEKLKH